MAIGTFFRGAYNQINPFDKGKTFSSAYDEEERRRRAALQHGIQTNNRNLVERAAAQINPFDRGATFDKPAPRMGQVIKVPTYKNPLERVGDMFEANSPQDIVKRQSAGLPTRYQDQKTDGLRFSLNPFNKGSFVGKVTDVQRKVSEGIVQTGVSAAQETARNIMTAVGGQQIANVQKNTQIDNAAKTVRDLMALSEDERNKLRNDPGARLAIEKAGLNPDDLSNASLTGQLQDLSNRDRSLTRDVVAENPAQRAVIGDRLESVGKRQQGLTKATGNRVFGTVGVPLALALDLVPGGGTAANKTAKLLKNVSDSAQVINILKKEGFNLTDDLAPIIDNIAKTNKTKEIEKLLKDINILNKGKVAEDAAQGASEVAKEKPIRAPFKTPEDVPPEVLPPGVRPKNPQYLANGMRVEMPKIDPNSVPPPIRPKEPIPLNVTNKETLSGQFQYGITDKDAPLINLAKRLERQNPNINKGTLDQLYYDTGLQRRAASVAGVDNSPELVSAFGGLGGKSKREFDDFVAAKQELANLSNGLKKTSQSPEELQAIVGSGETKFGTRFQALNQYYKSWAKRMYDGGLIDKKTFDTFVANDDYTRVQRVMDDLADANYGGGNSYSLGSTIATQKRIGSKRSIQPADFTAFEYGQKIQKEIQRNQTASNLIDALAKNGMARNLVDANDVRFRKDMYEFLAKTKQAPIKKVNEYVDANVRAGLEQLANNLGLNVKRIISNRGKWVGRSFDGQKRIELKAGAPERVMLHEIGHQLDEAYGIQDAVLGKNRSLSSKTLDAMIRKAKAASKDDPVAKDTVAILTKQKKLNEEVRKLAALRYEGQTPNKGFANYTRKGEEKVAVMFEAFLHAPDRFKKTAPTLYQDFVAFLKSNDKTAPILDVKPSLVIQKNVVQSREKNQALDDARKYAYKAALARADLETRNKNTLKRMVNGIPEVWEVPRDVKQAAENVKAFELGTARQIVVAPKRALQAGATGLSAPFTLANYIKDQMTSGIYSKKVFALDGSRGTHNPSNVAAGLWNAIKDFGYKSNDPLWQDFIKHAGNTTQYDNLRNVKSSKMLSREIRRGYAGKLANMALHPVRTLEDLNSVTEKATRFQNYRGTYKQVFDKTGDAEEATKAATLAAWQNSVDFNRMGPVTEALNLVIPYFNPGVQGTRTLGRALRNRPAATSAKIIGYAGVPALGVTLYNVSNADRKAIYDNISDYEKDNNIIVVLPGAYQDKQGTYHNVIKIPLQKDVAALTTGMRRAAEDYYRGNPQNAVALMQDLMNAFSGPIQTGTAAQALGSITPQAIKPIVQQGLNKDLFTGKPIVQDYIENATDAQGNPVPEQDKRYENTSATSGIIGDLTGTSPIRIDKFIKDTTGKVGQYVQNTLDTGLVLAGAAKPGSVGGVSVVDDLARRFVEASGKYNYNKSEGAKYYDNRTGAISSVGLNTAEKAAYDALHPTKSNFLGEELFDENKRITSYQRASTYLQFPKTFEVDKAMDQKARAEGKPGNPMFDLTPQQLTRVLLKATLPPGSKDPELSNLWKQEWYQDYSAQRTRYYDALKATMAKEGKQMPVQTNPYPQTSPELQKVMDSYSALPKGTGDRSRWIAANPDVFQQMVGQWNKVDQWENKERVSIGLSPIEDDGTSGSSGSYASGPKRSKAEQDKIDKTNENLGLSALFTGAIPKFGKLPATRARQNIQFRVPLPGKTPSKKRVRITL